MAFDFSLDKVPVRINTNVPVRIKNIIRITTDRNFVGTYAKDNFLGTEIADSKVSAVVVTLVVVLVLLVFGNKKKVQ